MKVSVFFSFLLSLLVFACRSNNTSLEFPKSHLRIALIDTVYMPSPDNACFISGNKLAFPRIRTGNDSVDFIINNTLKNKFTSYEYPNETLDSAFIHYSQNSVTEMNFSVTYNQDNILSLQIDAEWCTAHLSYFSHYFNFDLLTGKEIKLMEVINLDEKQKHLIQTSRQFQLQEYRKEMISVNKETPSELTDDELETILERTQECDSTFNFNEFVLYPDSFEIIWNCELPHYMRNYDPIFHLKYPNSN